MPIYRCNIKKTKSAKHHFWKNYDKRRDLFLKGIKSLGMTPVDAEVLFRDSEDDNKLIDSAFKCIGYPSDQCICYLFPYKQPLFKTTLHKIYVQNIVAEKSNFLGSRRNNSWNNAFCFR